MVRDVTIPASTWGGRLLEAYAVDLLPLERVESLFRQPRTPDPPPYAPTIRSVPIQGT